MPKSFLVKRFKSFHIEALIEDANYEDEIKSPSFPPTYLPDYRSEFSSNSSPGIQSLKCSCSCSQSDSVSTCSSDSLVSPLYEKNKYESIYSKFSSKSFKDFPDTYEVEHLNNTQTKDTSHCKQDEENDCFHRKGIYPITLGLEDTAKPFNCNICGKSFRLSSTLCRHKIIHTSQRPHKCYICFKSFNRSSTLKTHLRTHNTTKEFICKVCGKGFHQKGNLRNHTLIHTGEKPYQCRICSKAFNKLSNLKFHMHCHTDQKPYRCRFCKVSMARRGELKLHIATYHADEVEQK